jgi:hypothetical protein
VKHPARLPSKMILTRNYSRTTTTQAYFVTESVTKKKSFKILTSGSLATSKASGTTTCDAVPAAAATTTAAAATAEATATSPAAAAAIIFATATTASSTKTGKLHQKMRNKQRSFLME